MLLLLPLVTNRYKKASNWSLCRSNKFYTSKFIQVEIEIFVLQTE